MEILRTDIKKKLGEPEQSALGIQRNLSQFQGTDAGTPNSSINGQTDDLSKSLAEALPPAEDRTIMEKFAERRKLGEEEGAERRRK